MMPYRSHSARTPARYPGGGSRMPAVPGTDSSRIAAIVLGPSDWITRSRWCSARADSSSGVVAQNSLRYRKGPKKCACPRAYWFGIRRQSPVATIAAPVLPWYER